MRIKYIYICKYIHIHGSHKISRDKTLIQQLHQLNQVNFVTSET